MSYQKPSIEKVMVKLHVCTQADNKSSCYGGHCVRERYENDY